MPEHAVLDKDTIKIWIMPCLSVAERGFTSKFDLLEIVNSILYKLKNVLVRFDTTVSSWKGLNILAFISYFPEKNSQIKIV